MVEFLGEAARTIQPSSLSRSFLGGPAAELLLHVVQFTITRVRFDTHVHVGMDLSNVRTDTIQPS